MKKGLSLVMAAIMAAGFVAISGIGAKAEAQDLGLTNVGLRLGYNVNEMMTTYPYRYRGQTYYDTVYTYTDFGFHAGAYAEIALAEIDLGFETCVLGLSPALQISTTGAKTQSRRLPSDDPNTPDTIAVALSLNPAYLDVFLPLLFKWDFGGYSVGVELGAFGTFFLFGEAKSEENVVVKINDVVMQFDAGVMAGVAVEFGRAVNLSYRVTSGFVDSNVFSHYVSLGFNVWKN